MALTNWNVYQVGFTGVDIVFAGNPSTGQRCYTNYKGALIGPIRMDFTPFSGST